MQFTCNARAFLLALQRVNIRRNMYPYLLVREGEGKLTLLTATATSHWTPISKLNASTSLTETLALQKDGESVVHFQQLVNAIKGLGGGWGQTLDIRQEDRAIIVSCRGQHTRQTPVAIGETSEFPSLPQASDTEGTTYTRERTIRVQCATCQQWHAKTLTETFQVLRVLTQRAHCSEKEDLPSKLRQVAWAASENPYPKEALTGISAWLRDGVLSLVAGDTHCLVVRNHPLQEGASDWERGVLIPAQQLKSAMRLFPKRCDIMLEATGAFHQCVQSEEHEALEAPPIFRPEIIRLCTERLSVTLSLMHASPLKARSTPSQERVTRVECATADLLSAVNAATLVAQENNEVIWVHVGESHTRIEATHHEAAAPAQYDVPALIVGPAISVRLNCRYIKNALQAVHTPQMILEFGDGPEKPVVLRTGDDPGNYMCTLAPLAGKKS